MTPTLQTSANPGVVSDRHPLSARPCDSEASLFDLWWTNFRFGRPERLSGLHYWLGWEYRLLLDTMHIAPGASIVDIGSGEYSIWPYLLARHCSARVYATDLHPRLDAQLDRRRRAASAGIVAIDSVEFVRCDARHLPFAAHSVDAVTAVSTLEHVEGLHGGRLAVSEIARVLRPGGRAWITVPYRHAGSMIELDDSLDHFQWHYSPQSIVDSLLADSGLTVRRSVLYGERLPFYDLLRRSPPTLQRLIRPWSSLLSAVLLHATDQPGKASAVMLELEMDHSERI